MRQQFWKRWTADYLNQLQQRTKWKKDEGPPVQVGQMVIIREGNTPPLSWIVGRVVDIHPGADGVAKVASVRTAKGVFKRPATKLCIYILPLEE